MENLLTNFFCWGIEFVIMPNGEVYFCLISFAKQNDLNEENIISKVLKDPLLSKDTKKNVEFVGKTLKTIPYLVPFVYLNGLLFALDIEEFPIEAREKILEYKAITYEIISETLRESLDIYIANTYEE